MNSITLHENGKFDLLRKHFGKELSSEELDLFGIICQRTQLDPFIKQIYPVKRKVKQTDGSYKEVMVIQVAIDGLRSIAERTGCYAPGKEPSYTYGENNKIISATSYIKKMTTDGTWHDVSATAFMCEYKPKYGNFWDNMPHLMLAKCAEALAIRKAFPAQTSRVYTPEEMAQAQDAEISECLKTEITQDSQEKIGEEESCVLISLADQLDEQTQHAFYAWIKKEFNAGCIQDLPKDRFQICMTSLNAKIKYIKDKNREVVVA